MSSKEDYYNRKRIIAASVGSLLTNLAVTPFDVVKTRAQSNITLINSHTSTWGAMKKIVGKKGVAGLYKGLGAGMTMSIPSTVIYYVGYEALRDLFSPVINGYSPFVAGGLARIIAGLYILLADFSECYLAS